MITEKRINRRQFIVSSALGTSALSLGTKSHGMISNLSKTDETVYSPNDAIHIGMIAVGARAHQLIETIKRIPGTEIVAVCDAYKGRVERALERTNGRAKDYKNYKEILADKNIDAVVISTPDHLHTHEAVDAINAGKHIYIEKKRIIYWDKARDTVK